MKTISLEKMKANHKGKVVEILGGVNLQNRLMNMGIYKGKEITKIGHIGLKGPVIIKAGRSILALGRGMSAKIIIGAE